MNRTSLTLGLVCFGIACNGAAEPPIDDVVEPSPYILDDDRETPNEVDLAAVSVELQRTIDGIWALNGDPVLAAYETVSAAQTEVCPRTYAMNGNVYWFDQCTTDEGTSFNGYGFYYAFDDYPIGDNWYGSYDVISGAARVETPEGDALDLAGTASVISAAHTSQPALLFTSEVRGSFAWDGVGSEGTWLETGLKPDMSLQLYERTDSGGRMAQIDGGVSGMAGSTTALVFDEVTVIEAALGGPCEKEAHGIISLRTAQGTWIDLVFDGPSPETFTSDPAKCDGKGRAFFRGEELGEVTADFSQIFPVGAPW